MLRELFRRITTSRHTREREAAAERESVLREEFAQRTNALESQIQLLRAENRALLNSVLGVAGIPPIMVTAADLTATDVNGGSPKAGVPPANPLAASADHTGRQDAAAMKSAQAPKGGRIVAPMRRRSWHQIYRMLELESSRRKDQDS